jgi:RNA polymerase sigma-70 factor, ECF subfamily
MERLAEAGLISVTKSEEPSEFDLVVDRYKDSLVNYLTHLTGSRDQAHDFAQEAFVRMYTAWARVEPGREVGPYLFRIATNLVISHRRRSRRWLLIVPRLRRRDMTEITPQALLIQSEVQLKVRAALEQLPMRYRSALVLHEIEGWSYRDIAVALGCREGTVKSRINRAKHELRRLLADYWNGDPEDGT